MKPVVTPEGLVSVFGLIHEYYTPAAIAESIPTVGRAPGSNERLVRAFGRPRHLEVGAAVDAAVGGQFGLVLTKPPYGAGTAATARESTPSDVATPRPGTTS